MPYASCHFGYNGAKLGPPPALLSLKQPYGYGAFGKFNLTFSSMGHVCLSF
jgi:hypothetical protein